jgi:DNA-binding NtrC family response regulator
MAHTVLVIDDDAMIRNYLGNILREDGFEVLLSATGGEGEAALRAKPVDIVLLDLKLPDADGITVLQSLKQIDPNVQVIMLTAFSEVPSAVKAMRLGAYEYLEKPSDLRKLKTTISRALKELTMKREIERLRHKPGGHAQRWILGQSEKMQRIARVVAKVAQENTTVLIQGESGTGKEVVAQAIKERSRRSDKPFVVINCAAIPEPLLESELFGFEAGAFTSAKRRKKGLLEIADGGTLFLDEISEMAPQMQAKILRVLETKTLRRIGGTTDIKVDVRFIAASNRDLRRAVREGMMREDLYYRLGVVVIRLPPLRERMQDLELFVDAFIDEFNRAMGKSIVGVSPEALQLMRNYSWPGNIRELRNVIERAMVLCDEREFRPVHLPAELSEQFFSLSDLALPRFHIEIPPEGIHLEELVSQLEVRLIRQALGRTDGNQSEAARLLSISRDQLRYRLEKYDQLDT